MNWQTKSISEFCHTGSGGTPSRKEQSKFYGGDIPWVKSGELRESVITETEETITAAAIKETSVKLIPSGALLVAMYGATVGRIAILGIEATSNQAVCHIIPNEQVAERRYMFYALQKQVPKWLDQRVGAAQPNISQQIIRETQIPLPPIAEQHRIAEILDRADAIRHKRQQAIALTEELLRSTFLDMFGDPATNPKGWEVVKMADITRETQYGTSDKANSDGHGFPVLRMNNITYAGELNLRDLKWCPITEKDQAKFTVQRGDLLFNRTNSPELVGKTAVWRNDEQYAFAGYLVRVRFKENQALSEYVSAYLNSSHGKRFLFEKAKASINMSNFSASEFVKIPLLLPPLDLQKRFLRIVDATRLHTKRLQEVLKEADNLFNSLMQRAFRGEL